MLQVRTEFPYAGSEAFLRGTAGRVTIISRNADGTATVKLHPPKFMSAEQRIEWNNRGASLTTKVDAKDLYETELLATFCGKLPKKLRARGRAR